MNIPKSKITKKLMNEIIVWLTQEQKELIIDTYAISRSINPMKGFRIDHEKMPEWIKNIHRLRPLTELIEKQFPQLENWMVGDFYSKFYTAYKKGDK